MDFTIDYEYQRYLEATMEEQIELEHCVNEALALSNGNINNYREIFVESVGDKIKSGWQKFIAWIKKVWAKFTESLSNIFAGTKEYLEKYKDIILKKKVKEGFTVDIPDHKTGLQRIVNTSIDVIQPDDIRKIIVGSAAEKNGVDSKDIGKVFSDSPQMTQVYKVLDAANATMEDQSERLSNLKTYFLGGEARSVSMDDETSINMTDIYNTCYEKEKAINNITKEENNFLKNCENIAKIFEEETNKLLNDAKAGAAQSTNQEEQPKEDPDIKELNNTAQQAVTGTNTGSGTGSGNGNSVTAINKAHEELTGIRSSALYSNLYGSYISEGIVHAVSSSSSTSSSGSSGNGLGNAVSGTVRTQAADKDKYQNATKTAGANITNHYSKEQATEIINAAKNTLTEYRTICGNVFTAKINAMNTIYKNYFEIIRTHVRSYVGDEDNALDDRAVRAGTQYSNPNEQKPAPAKK